MEIGTLQELNVKAGDVVEFVSGDVSGFKEGKDYLCVSGSDGFGKPAIGPINEVGVYIPSINSDLVFHIISRANTPVESDKPRTWGEMTPEEKGALLLASHEWKVIEFYLDGKWMSCAPKWRDDYAYRIRPEPKRETVTLYGGYNENWEDDAWLFNLHSCGALDTHSFTFPTLNGKPISGTFTNENGDVIKMEEL